MIASCSLSLKMKARGDATFDPVCLLECRGLRDLDRYCRGGTEDGELTPMSTRTRSLRPALSSAKRSRCRIGVYTSRRQLGSSSVPRRLVSSTSTSTSTLPLLFPLGPLTPIFCIFSTSTSLGGLLHSRNTISTYPFSPRLESRCASVARSG